MHDLSINLDIEDLDYPLSEDKIAKFPIQPKDQSKLLVYENAQIKDDYFYNLSCFLPSSSLIIFNNSKTIPARLIFENGLHNIEIFCLKSIKGKGIESILNDKKGVDIIGLVGNLKKWRSGDLTHTINIHPHQIVLKASLIEKIEATKNHFLIRLIWDNDKFNFGDILKFFGTLPLPPYLKRKTTIEDQTFYQTIYSLIEGSVATPTAGLHFTPNTFKQLEKKNIQTEYITLHVGADTFKPINEKNVYNHAMHGENINVDKQCIASLIENHAQIFAVGTTTLRTLESLYYVGLCIAQHKAYQSIPQFPNIDPKHEISFLESMQFILQHLTQSQKQYLSFNTSLMIHPHIKIKSIKGLITNFHQPRSTLLLILKTLIGDNWKSMYQHALQNDYRFLSYGDANLIIR